MNAQTFLTWMRSARTPSENPGSTSREESAQLDALLDAFPYFQSGHLLYIKNLHNQGSFLYNNQLKTAAAYAVNRKVLYELIKQTGVGSKEAGELDSEKSKVRSEKSAVRSEKSEPGLKKTEGEEKKGEHVSVPPKFPPKKFTSNPDEWEAGMLRQLQLLHHWQQLGDERSETGVHQVPTSPFNTSQENKNKPAEADDSKNDTESIPAAKDEINTLLYVLVEPGQSEDLAEEINEEQIVEPVNEEAESTQWEIKPAEETVEEPIVKPADSVQQDILVEAIHSSLEMEVDDTLPSVDELKPFRLEPAAETEEEKKPEPVSASEENVVTSFENMSFSEWLREVNKKTPAPLPKTVLSEDTLIEKFIQEEPRIKGKKSGFYNPVNMAKKSVQESDEFITETLARIYAKQGNFTKAIRAYQKLSLKFPEKTAYFAALIEELKRTPNK